MLVCGKQGIVSSNAKAFGFQPNKEKTTSISSHKLHGDSKI